MTTKPSLQRTLKEIPQTEDEDKYRYESMGINKSHQMSR
jgi:hypothetical protein